MGPITGHATALFVVSYDMNGSLLRTSLILAAVDVDNARRISRIKYSANSTQHTVGAAWAVGVTGRREGNNSKLMTSA